MNYLIRIYVAIIYALIKNGYLTEDRILVIDEPEVHLHPKWQLEYAKLIVSFVKKGVKVLVNSHSPYMIEALDIIANKSKISFNSYYAENGEVVEDNNLEKSIKKLLTPMKELKKLRYE